MKPNKEHQPDIMVFDASSVATFFKDGVIGFDTCTYAKLVVEGIHLPGDLTDFNKDGLETIFENFRRPGKVKVPKDNTEKAKRKLGTPMNTRSWTSPRMCTPPSPKCVSLWR